MLNSNVDEESKRPTSKKRPRSKKATNREVTNRIDAAAAEPEAPTQTKRTGRRKKITTAAPQALNVNTLESMDDDAKSAPRSKSTHKTQKSLNIFKRKNTRDKSEKAESRLGR